MNVELPGNEHSAGYFYSMVACSFVSAFLLSYYFLKRRR